jgi:hypothetical protein
MFQSEMKIALDAEGVRQAARAATRRCRSSPFRNETLAVLHGGHVAAKPWSAA